MREDDGLIAERSAIPVLFVIPANAGIHTKVFGVLKRCELKAKKLDPRVREDDGDVDLAKAP